MLIKIAVLIAMAVYAYSQGEPVLAGAFLLGLIPSVGLLITAINVVILLFKGWYGSAAIIGGLIAFNLLGNAYMAKKLAVSNEENKDPERGVLESLGLTILILTFIIASLALLFSLITSKSPASNVAIEEPPPLPAEPAPNPPSGIDWSSAPTASKGVEGYQPAPTLREIEATSNIAKHLRELEAINQRHQPQVDDPSSFAKKKFRNNVASSSGCESGHWVDSVSDDGDIVKLEDGSVWEIAAADTVDSMLWLPTTDIIACDDKLINTEDNETVEAVRLK